MKQQKHNIKLYNWTASVQGDFSPERYRLGFVYV
jgi:hypothetical protein